MQWSITQPSKRMKSCNDVDGARVYYVKQNKSSRERQIPYDCTHMWNLRNKTDEHMGTGWGREERETNHKRLIMMVNNMRVDRETQVGNGLDGRWVLKRSLVVMSPGCCM